MRWLIICSVVISGCVAPKPVSPRAQTIINVLCATTGRYQPIVIPLVISALPLTGPYAPGVAIAVATDTILVHPRVVAACAKYGTIPVSTVAITPVVVEEENDG